MSIGGYNSKIFFVKPANSVICPLCVKVLKNPKQCMNGHCYCHDCIVQSLNDRMECPKCQIALTANTLGQSVLGQAVIEELLTLCPSRDNLTDDLDECCQWVGKLVDREAHLSTCMFSRFDATCDHCGESFSSQGLFEHESKCAYRPVYCTNDCGEIMASNQMETHDQNECPLQLVACPLNALGVCDDCSGTVLRRDLKSHVAGNDHIATTVLKLANCAVSQQVQQRESAIFIQKLLEDNASLKLQLESHKQIYDLLMKQVTSVADEKKLLHTKLNELSAQNAMFATQLKASTNQTTGTTSGSSVAVTSAAVKRTLTSSVPERKSSPTFKATSTATPTVWRAQSSYAPSTTGTGTTAASSPSLSPLGSTAAVRPGPLSGRVTTTSGY